MSSTGKEKKRRLSFQEIKRQTTFFYRHRIFTFDSNRLASGNNYTRMSEAIAVPVPTTPTSPNGATKFQGEGLVFKAKLIGMEDLPVDRDEKACLESMFKLKAVAKARGEHKQRIQMNLTMSSVKVTDETTKVEEKRTRKSFSSFVRFDVSRR